MNRAISLCAVVVLAALASGCATTSEPTASYVPPVSTSGEIEQDDAYIQRVQQIALRRGIGVTWVNPPTRRKSRETN